MTLIVAIPAEDGVVLGSDSQVTTGPVRSTIQKIRQLNDHALWGASGELALIQRVAERIQALPERDHPLANYRDALGGVVMEAVQALLRIDFRTQFFAASPNQLLELHPGDFLFAEYRDESRVLHISSNGTPEWIDDRLAASGVGDQFAHALMRKFEGVRLSCERAKLLAYKVIEEVIEVGAWGLGPPIDIWQVSRDGVRQAANEEIEALDDSARVIREQEVEMLSSHRVRPQAANAAGSC